MQSYLVGLCPDSDCEDGHEFDTDINCELLRKLNVENPTPQNLKKLLKQDTIAPHLCEEYNLDKCGKGAYRCVKMHICADFILGTCMGCKLNHNVMDPQCKKLLEQAHGPRRWHKLSLAEEIKQQCNISSGIIDLPLVNVMESKERRLRKYEIGNKNLGAGPTKVLMIVGATGAGKSTLINGIANFVFGVRWENDFRFKLVADEGSRKSQAHSQTKWITAYDLHKQEGFALPYGLTVIDTPGFGDTDGIHADEELRNQIRAFFSHGEDFGVDQLDGICFVVQSAMARLTATQQYIFDSILSVFGKDVNDNIYVFVTFADSKKPPALEAIEYAKIPYKDHFKFNNAALFPEPGKAAELIDKSYWDMSSQSFKKFFKKFNKTKAVSLTLTKEVLKERKTLAAVLQGIQPQIFAALGRLEHLRQEHTTLRQHEADLQANKQFEYKVKILKQEKVDLKEEFVTNCLTCNYTCHYPCTVSDDNLKGDCHVVDYQTGRCLVCPNKCSWRKHVNNTYRFDLKEEEITQTSDELKAKYEQAAGKKLNAQGIMKELMNKFNEERAEVLNLTKVAHRCLQRLEEIALKPDPLGVTAYIDLLIESERREARPGFSQRMRYLEDTRAKAELATKLKDDFDPFKEYMKEFEQENFNISLFDPDPEDTDNSETESPSHAGEISTTSLHESGESSQTVLE
ncbi:unnamed protein product [Darwinula stevensoni]|uniref:Septin-type G domain-containing protein n=1 Tax=Darwinula stevensoni TaxID=69355 RepID=A0A7R9A5Q6_9CRUS|nr:unnamed protein product [Darwinula stevensoni]CAG0886990.1 unnamed protein product [Darwinula stevensoni]